MICETPRCGRCVAVVHLLVCSSRCYRDWCSRFASCPSEIPPLSDLCRTSVFRTAAPRASRRRDQGCVEGRMSYGRKGSSLNTRTRSIRWDLWTTGALAGYLDHQLCPHRSIVTLNHELLSPGVHMRKSKRLSLACLGFFACGHEAAEGVEIIANRKEARRSVRRVELPEHIQQC